MKSNRELLGEVLWKTSESIIKYVYTGLDLKVTDASRVLRLLLESIISNAR